MAEDFPEQYLYLKICANLARYYDSKHVGDSYFNADKVGKFTEFCEDNGTTEDDAILEELAQDDPNESLFADIDEDFPGIEANASDQERAAKILEILRKCAKNGHVTVEAMEITPSQYRDNENDLKIMMATHKKQCPLIFGQAHLEEDGALLKLIAMSQKMGENYLCFLVDMYNRERLENHNFSDLNIFTPASWAKRCQHLQKLDKLSMMKYRIGDEGKPSDNAKAAVESFLLRICPQLQLNAPNLICDSIQKTSQYIDAIIAFVSRLADAFAFNKSIKKPVVAHYHNEYSDDDDESDGSEYDENKFEFFDVFGAVKQKLNANKLIFHSRTVPVDADKSTFRAIMESFNEYKNQIKQKYGKDKVMNEYPRKHRFCALIDRRQPDDGDNKNKDILKEDELIIYEPPSDCSEFPKDAQQPLFYFETSKTCIIPNETYPKEVDKKNDDEKKNEIDEQQLAMNKIINSQSTCNGAIMTLSFHVESVDEIRCYIYSNGQAMRFMPEDIRELLPLLFDSEYENNKKWITSNECYQIVDRMNVKLKDPKFEAFLEKYMAKKEDHLENIPIRSKFVIEVVQ